MAINADPQLEEESRFFYRYTGSNRALVAEFVDSPSYVIYTWLTVWRPQRKNYTSSSPP